MKIVCRGQHIAVELVEEIAGHFDDLYDFEDILLRDDAGNYYLKHVRMFKMSPNAEAAFDRRRCEIAHLPNGSPEIAVLRAFQLKHIKPRITIKRITEKTPLLWCVHQMFNDDLIRSRLRNAINKLV
jgi:hypothetical protein